MEEAEAVPSTVRRAGRRWKPELAAGDGGRRSVRVPARRGMRPPTDWETGPKIEELSAPSAAMRPVVLHLGVMRPCPVDGNVS